jgi:alcohol dehydrogenase (cytochrome c)
VGGLRPVWALSTGGKLGGLEETPLVRDGVMYFSADYGRVFAVDARTGVTKWTYEPEYEEGLTAMLCCGPIHRGVALRDELVYLTRLDAKLVALNRADGTVAWEQKIDEWTEGKTANHAPLVVGDRVFVGVSGGEYGVRGYVKAYDAKTGAPLWTTYTVPAPGEPGNDTWPGEMWKTGGGPTWLTGAYDAETDTLFWGTGNPGPWAGDMRPGDNLDHSTSPRPGKIKWGFGTPNDLGL